MRVASCTGISTLSLLFRLCQAQFHASDFRTTGNVVPTQTSASNRAFSTFASSVVPAISRSPSLTPVSAAASTLVSTSSNNGLSEKSLGIILAAVICGITVLMLIVILVCAFRRRDGSRTYTRTPSPDAPMSMSVAGSLRSLTARRLFSSHSADAPELAVVDGGRRLSSVRRSSSIRRQPTWSRGMFPELDDINESPAITPLKQAHQRSQDSVLQSELLSEPSRSSLSRYHSRSQDVISAASLKSTDATSDYHRKSSTYASERYSRSSETDRLPHSASNSIAPLRQTHSHPPQPDDRHRSLNEGDMITPVIPARNPRRGSSPLVHYPSWNEIQNFNFDSRDENSRRVSRTALSRLSDGWRPGGDRASGRYELA